jgi:dual-specificity kinase
VEFFTGDALFQTHDNLEHLAMMEAVCGKRLDTHLIQSVNGMAKRNSGNPAAKYVFQTATLCLCSNLCVDSSSG